MYRDALAPALLLRSRARTVNRAATDQTQSCRLNLRSMPILNRPWSIVKRCSALTYADLPEFRDAFSGFRGRLATVRRPHPAPLARRLRSRTGWNCVSGSRAPGEHCSDSGRCPDGVERRWEGYFVCAVEDKSLQARPSFTLREGAHWRRRRDEVVARNFDCSRASSYLEGVWNVC